jgi:hypothetical protein
METDSSLESTGAHVRAQRPLGQFLQRAHLSRDIRPCCARGRTLSNLCMLSYFQRILDVHAEISNCVFNFGMSKQYLDCTNISCGFVNHCGICWSE